MNINIDPTDGVPIYRQIANQVRYMVASGLLLADEELPPIRVLAQQLRVTPNTVVKAYDELERAGVIHKRRGAGCFVSATPSKLADTEKQRILEQRIDALLLEAHQLDVDDATLLELLQERMARLQAPPTTRKERGGE
jgi:GntR family transcriptional regulator